MLVEVADVLLYNLCNLGREGQEDFRSRLVLALARPVGLDVDVNTFVYQPMISKQCYIILYNYTYIRCQHVHMTQ